MDFDDVFLQRKPYIPAQTMLIRKEALEKVGGFDPAVKVEDFYIQLKITHAGYYIDALGVTMARYRVHPTNTAKNVRFTTETALRVYQEYSDHPAYEEALYGYMGEALLMALRRDKMFACELIAQLPPRAWGRTLTGLLRAVFARIAKQFLWKTPPSA